MNLNEVKRNLNKRVIYGCKRLFLDDSDGYILTGCILRLSRQGEYFYQAELIEEKSGCVVIASLEDVKEIRGTR